MWFRSNTTPGIKFPIISCNLMLCMTGIWCFVAYNKLFMINAKWDCCKIIYISITQIFLPSEFVKCNCCKKKHFSHYKYYYNNKDTIEINTKQSYSRSSVTKPCIIHTHLYNPDMYWQLRACIIPLEHVKVEDMKPKSWHLLKETKREVWRNSQTWAIYTLPGQHWHTQSQAQILK